MVETDVEIVLWFVCPGLKWDKWDSAPHWDLVGRRGTFYFPDGLTYRCLLGASVSRTR